MGVTHINYKLAECDICGKTSEFNPELKLPNKWNSISFGFSISSYSCICPQCFDNISNYIKQLKESYKADNKTKTER